MPFQLWNALAAFQRWINEVLMEQIDIFALSMWMTYSYIRTLYNNTEKTSATSSRQYENQG